MDRERQSLKSATITFHSSYPHLIPSLRTHCAKPFSSYSCFEIQKSWNRRPLPYAHNNDNHTPPLPINLLLYTPSSWKIRWLMPMKIPYLSIYKPYLLIRPPANKHPLEKPLLLHFYRHICLLLQRHIPFRKLSTNFWLKTIFIWNDELPKSLLLPNFFFSIQLFINLFT